MRLIDADELLEHLEACLQNGRPLSNLYDLREIVRYVKSMPTIAAPRWHRVEEPPKEEWRYWCAKKFAGHWIFFAAWYWNNVSDYTGVPVGEEEKADGFVFGEDVVYPDYWMPIEPPKEEVDANK